MCTLCRYASQRNQATYLRQKARMQARIAELRARIVASQAAAAAAAQAKLAAAIKPAAAANASAAAKPAAAVQGLVIPPLSAAQPQRIVQFTLTQRRCCRRTPQGVWVVRRRTVVSRSVSHVSLDALRSLKHIYVNCFIRL